MDKKVAKSIRRKYAGMKLGPIIHPKGKNKVFQVIRGGLTCDDRKLTGFSKIKNEGPVCKKCNLVMEKFQAKYFCRVCHASRNEDKWKKRISERNKSKKHRPLKTNQDLLERNKQKFLKHSYTGR